MLLEKNESVKVLVPAKNKSIEQSNWHYFISTDALSFVGTIMFEKKIYYVFEGKVETNPSLHTLKVRDNLE